MPYEKHSVTVHCEKFDCSNNEDEKCACDEDVEDLDPNNSSRCFMYHSCFEDETQLKFDSMDELLEFAEDKKYIAPLVVYDDSALNLVYVDIKCPRKDSAHEHKALVQMSREDVKQVEFRPSIDGSVVIVPKIQIEMPSLLCA